MQDEGCVYPNLYKSVEVIMEVIRKARNLIDAEHYDEATELIFSLAEHGDSEAQFLLGYLYFTSADVTRAESIKWLCKAVDKDHPEACYYLSKCSQENFTGPPTDDESWKLLFKAAELGSKDAQ